MPLRTSMQRQVLFASAALAVIAGGVTSMNRTPVSANHANANPCYVVIASERDAGAVGYRTIKVELSRDPNEVINGHENQGNCTIDGSILNLGEKRATGIYFGPQTWDGYSSDSYDFVNGCVGIAPTQPGVGNCRNTGRAYEDNYWEVFQDDAGYITLGDDLVYCNGFTFSGDCGGGDIYRGGVEPSGSAVRGAGFYNIDPFELTGYMGRNPDGTLQDIPVQIGARNTWTNGQFFIGVFTLRYEYVPPDQCNNLAGYQTSPPANSYRDGAGNCVVTIEGRIWDYNNINVNLGGVQVFTCNYGTVTTGGDGMFRFTADYGGAFCLRVTGGVPAGYDPATVRTFPWAEGYNGCAATAPCIHDRYEFQVGGGYFGGMDRTQDWGFDFTIRQLQRPPAGSINVSCNAVTGNARDPDFSGSIRVRLFIDGPEGGGGTYLGEQNTDGANNFAFDVSAYKDYGTHSFWVYAVGKDYNGNEDGLNATLTNSGSSTPVCTPPACGSMTTDPANPEPGTPFTVTVNFNYSPGGSGRRIARSSGHVMRLRAVALPSVYDNVDQPYDNPVPPGSGQATTGTLVAAVPGNHTVTMTLSGGPVLSPGGNCEWTVQVASKPYFRVYGGDVLAGASGFGTCLPGAGDIRAWNRGPANGWSGAGTQLAAYAVGAIDQFASAQSRSTDPTPPEDLTFANTSGTYGGNWGAGNIPCQEDYFKFRTGSDPGAFFDLSGINGAFSRSGPTTITGGSVPQGRRIAIYVDGDVAITGNIQFAGAYNGVDRIPSIRIIARGNIYIAPGVTNVDAVLIAQPNGASGGTIVTCSNGGFGPPLVSQLIGVVLSCRNKLTVYGALLAREIRFMRTQGTVRESDNSHDSSNPTIAEVIIYSPEVWLANAAGTPPGREPYEAFTSLPPIL